MYLYELLLMDGAPEAAPRYRVGSSHSGADFEAGRLGHRNGEAPNDGAEHEVVNAQEPPMMGAAGTGLRAASTGRESPKGRRSVMDSFGNVCSLTIIRLQTKLKLSNCNSNYKFEIV